MAPLLLALLAAEPSPLVYAQHEKTQAWTISDWSKAPRVWTAAHGVALREKPDEKSAVVAELPFGVPVKLLQPMDRWYRVASEGKAGYLATESLTSARYEDDFDGDGEKELATVAFTPDFMIRVRFFEPKAKTEAFVDVHPAGGAYLSLKGGHAYPEALTKAQAGLPLVHVGSHEEACADLADYWVSYVDGVPRVALAQHGLIDPPNHYAYKVELQPKLKRALVHLEKAEEEDKPLKKWTETFTLDGGVFTKRAE